MDDLGLMTHVKKSEVRMHDLQVGMQVSVQLEVIIPSCCKLVDFTHLRDVKNLLIKEIIYYIISIHHPVPGSDIPVALHYSPPFFPPQEGR